MPKLSLSAVALSLVVAVSAGAQKPAAEKAGAAKPAAGPVGTFSSTITKADVPASMGKGMVDTLAGTWSLTFAAGKPAIVKHNGTEVVSSPMTFSAGKMNIGADDTGPYKCGVAAVYSYTETRTSLTMKSVGEDQCAGRALVLTKRPFKKGA